MTKVDGKQASNHKTDRLKVEYKRFFFAFRVIGGGVWDYDVAKGTLHCSRRWHEILGLDSRRSPVTSMDEFKAHIHPDDVPAATEIDLIALNKLIARDERYVAEFRIIRPNGDVRWVRSVACLVRQRDRRLRAIGCLTDVTDLHADAPIDQAAPHAEHAGSILPVQPAPADAIILSAHERECLLWVSFGKTAWETAAILGKSQRTVEFHLGKAVRKLDAANKVHAAVLAIRQGLL